MDLPIYSLGQLRKENIYPEWTSSVMNSILNTETVWLELVAEPRQSPAAAWCLNEARAARKYQKKTKTSSTWWFSILASPFPLDKCDHQHQQLTKQWSRPEETHRPQTPEVNNTWSERVNCARARRVSLGAKSPLLQIQPWACLS